MTTKQPKTIGIWLVALALVTGCGMKQGFEDSSRTNTAIKQQLGLDASTFWENTNGHQHVRVRLAAPPPGDAAVAKSAIAAVVLRTFRGKIERVDVEF